MARLESLKRVLRTAQSHVPAIRPAKFAAYNWLTRTLGWHIDPDFRLLAHLPQVGLAVDVGGNWGQSIHALRRTARPQRIVSFEPNPVLAANLRRSFAGDPAVAIEACGLGDVAGDFRLHVPSYRGYVYDGLASLDEHEARTWLNPQRMVAFDPARLTIQAYDVPVRTLDSFGFAPDVLKIDVQGLELQVVQGGSGTIARHRPITIVEAPSPALVALFAELGLAPHRYDGRTLHAGDTSAKNTIFLSPDRRAALRLPG